MNTKDFYYQHDDRTYLSTEACRYLLEHDLLLDATEGGLIVGPLLAEGGVRLVNFTKKGECFVNKPVDGWTYLLNTYACFYEQEQINTLMTTLIEKMIGHTPYNVPETVKVFDATPRVIDGQQITPFIYTGSPETCFIDRVTTKKYLEQIHRLNQQAWQKYFKGLKDDNDINLSGSIAWNTKQSNN
jgi:hypothetical protein